MAYQSAVASRERVGARYSGSRADALSYSAVSPGGAGNGRDGGGQPRGVLEHLHKLGHLPVDIRETRGNAQSAGARRQLAVLPAAIRAPGYALHP